MTTTSVPGVPSPVDTTVADHYVWGAACDGWRFLDAGDLSVILERVPGGATETAHVHDRVRQFFFVLEGEAALEVEGAVVRLVPGQGLHVPPGTPHRFHNPGDRDVRFLVVSSGRARDDRRDPPHVAGRDT